MIYPMAVCAIAEIIEIQATAEEAASKKFPECTQELRRKQYAEAYLDGVWAERCSHYPRTPHVKPTH